MTSSREVSVVIPIYNSSQTLDELFTRVITTMQSCTDRFEMVLVNDGSSDDSWHKLQELSKKYDFVTIKCINLRRNYGQHNAILCGVRHASLAITVTIDDDLQNPPEEIPLVLAKLSESADVVYGAALAKQHGLFRNWSSLLLRLVLAKCLGAPAARHVSAFRAFRTSLREGFASCNSSCILFDALLSWTTNKFGFVYVKHSPRLHGRSNYDFLKLVTQALTTLTALTTVPLQIAMFLGFACVILGLMLLLYVFVQVAIGDGSVPGFPFLASITIIFSGTQLFSLGIIGEYVGRIYLQSLQKPGYAIEAVTDTVSSFLIETQGVMVFAPPVADSLNMR